jgi:hypothetical protein
MENKIAWYVFLLITSPIWIFPVLVAYLLRLIGIKLI